MNPPDETTGDRSRFRSDPHPALRPFVVEYWGMARDLAAMGGFTITPDCFGELICCADDLFAIREGGREKLPGCFLIGLLDAPLRVEAAGVVRCMAARLRPWSLGQMATVGLDSPPRPWKDAGGLFGPRLAEMTEGVRGCEWAGLVPLFDEVLIRKIGCWMGSPADFGVAERFLGPDRGPTASVADDRRITPRQVERRVRRLTTTSPKQLACLARFQEVRDAIWADPTVDLAGLAIRAGYSDQPHMTRQFRRYSGQTPSQFAHASAAKKKWLKSRDVAFVQEGDEGED